MIVMKFGGTSVRDALWIDKALDIAESSLDRAPVLVSSAMGDSTNIILKLICLAETGRSVDMGPFFHNMKKAHLETAMTFLGGDNLKTCESSLNTLFQDFSSFLKGLSLLGECSKRSKDAILSFGERLATLIIFHRALERKIPALLLDARDFMITDENFSNARPLVKKTEPAIKKMLHPYPGKLIITQGFIGASEKGITTTLGRGGSDYSAAILGAALNAEEIQIWTDVNGIMTSDPRIVEQAHTIASMTYREAGELAYFGAKVVHPATIQPAVKKGIPVLVRNTGNPGNQGTRIEGAHHQTGLKAIAAKKGNLIININSSLMLNAYGFLARIFGIFEKYKVPVELISTSEVSVSITIEPCEQLEEIVHDLNQIGNTSIEENKSIICLVGQNLWKDSSFIARVFSLLENVAVRMISLGSSDINLSVVVSEEDTDQIIRKLHKALLA